MDSLIGRHVVDRNGESVGRIHELRADVNGAHWTVTHFVVGVGGLLERLGVALKLIVGGTMRPYIVPVEHMDLSDPHRPRVRMHAIRVATAVNTGCCFSNRPSTAVTVRQPLRRDR